MKILLEKHSCYEYETYSFDSPLFTTIQVGFVITMADDRSRVDAFLRRFHSTPLTRHLIVVLNSGFRSCAKANVTNSGQDLWHANKAIFGACRDVPSPILVMEDDAEFDVSLRDAERIEAFLGRRRVDAYSLGCVPLISHPVSPYHARMHCAFYAQAVVYTSSGRRKLMAAHVCRLHDVEALARVRYYGCLRPVAVQKIVPTVNSANRLTLFYSKLFAADAQGRTYFRFHSGTTLAGGSLPFYLGVVTLVVIAARRTRALRISNTFLFGSLCT